MEFDLKNLVLTLLIMKDAKNYGRVQMPRICVTANDHSRHRHWDKKGKNNDANKARSFDGASTLPQGGWEN